MNTNERPKLRDHDSFLTNLSSLNEHDKLSGQRIAGTNRFDWYKTETGFSQGLDRACHNAIQSTKQYAEKKMKSLQRSVSSYVNLFTTQLIQADPNNPPQPAIMDSTPVAPAPEKEPLPNYLGNASQVSRGIKKEAKEISKKIDACPNFIEHCNDANELEILKNDLNFVKIGMNANLAGLSNLAKTYEYATGSKLQYVKRNTGKYFDALKNFKKVSENTQKDLQKIEPLLNQINEKIQKLKSENPLALSSFKSAYSVGLNTPTDFLPGALLSPFSQDSLLPKNFPQSLDSSPRNMLVSIREFLSNPFYTSQKENRKIHCDLNGELSLQGENTSGTDDVQNLMQMVAETYGYETRNLLTILLETNTWDSLTVGRMKSVLAMLAAAANPTLASRLTGQENCLSLLSEENQVDASQNPEENYIHIQYAMTHLVNPQGAILKTEQLFHKEYIDALKKSQTPASVKAKQAFEQKLKSAKQKPRAKTLRPSQKASASGNIIDYSEKKAELEEIESKPTLPQTSSEKASSQQISSNSVDALDDADNSISEIVITEVIKSPLSLEPKSIFQPTKTMPEIKNYHYPHLLIEEEIRANPNFKEILDINKILKKNEWNAVRKKFLEIAKNRVVKEIDSSYKALNAAWVTLEPLLKEKLEENKKLETLKAQNNDQNSDQPHSEIVIQELPKSGIPIPPPPPPPVALKGVPIPPPPPPVAAKGVPIPPPPPPLGKAKEVRKNAAPLDVEKNLRPVPVEIDLPEIILDNDSLDGKFMAALSDYQTAQAALVESLFPYHLDIAIIYPGLEEFKPEGKNAISKEQLSHVMESFKNDADLEHNIVGRSKAVHVEKEEAILTASEKKFLEMLTTKKETLRVAKAKFEEKSNEYSQIESDYKKAHAEYVKVSNIPSKSLEAHTRYTTLQMQYKAKGPALRELIALLREETKTATLDLQKFIDSEAGSINALLLEATKLITAVGKGNWEGEIPAEVQAALSKRAVKAKAPNSVKQGDAGEQEISSDGIVLRKKGEVRPKYVPAENINLIKLKYYNQKIKFLRNTKEWGEVICKRENTDYTLEKVVADGFAKVQKLENGLFRDDLNTLFLERYNSECVQYVSEVLENEFLINTAIGTKSDSEFQAQAEAYRKLQNNEVLSDEEQAATTQFVELFKSQAAAYAQQRLNGEAPEVDWDLSN